METLSPRKAGTESIKLNKEVVNKVRKSKKKTGVPIGKFFEQAAEEKLNKKCEHYFVSSVAYKGAKICAKCGIYK